MKKTVLILSLVAGLPVIADDNVEVATTAKRQSAITTSETMLSQAVGAFPADALDPFHSPFFADAAQGRPAADPSAKPAPHVSLLATLAAGLKPSGNFLIGGEPVLVFGPKRVKTGETLIVSHEGTTYTLEITAINRTSFTLRLNQEEFTRPIK